MVTAKIRGWRFGVFELDLDRHELRKRGVHIQLAGQPLQALTLLLQRPGSVVTREELCGALWPGEQWGDHDQRLNKAINKVRDALSDSADTPRLIETVPRVGYRFLVQVIPRTVPELEPIEQPESQPEAAVAEAQATAPSSHPPPIEQTTIVAPPDRKAAAALGLSVLLIAAVLVGAMFYRRTERGTIGSKSDAVLTVAQAKPLTTYLGSEQYPAFSPDNRWIAFAWNGVEQAASHIYTISLDHKALKQITHGESSDYAPVWSPDASQLAFVRESAGLGKQLFAMSAEGGPKERKIADFGSITRDDHPMTWTRNPKWLIAALSLRGEGPSALYLISSETGEHRRLTSPGLQSAGDLSPSISPDGKRVAFTRGATVARRDIFLLSLTGELSPAADPVRVTDLNRVVDTFAWAPDGSELYLSASPTFSGARHISRISLSSAGPVTNAVETGIEGIHPALSPSGDTLCYVRSNIEQSSIWRLDMPRIPGAQPERRRLLSSTRRDYTADLSPDGKRLVFSSVRSGDSEVWVSDVDGTNLKQVTFAGASTPRWSPDGERIVYESPAAKQPDIYVFDLKTNTELRLTTDPGADLRPSWSRDGRQIYFMSARTGRSQIWRIPSHGGAETQITWDGGVYAVESMDGQTLYYTSASHPPSIRYAPTSGSGPERTLVENVVGFSGISLGRDGLYYLSSISVTGGQVDFYSFAGNTSRPLLTIDRPVHHFLSSSQDGGSLLFSQVDQRDTDLMLLRLK